VDAEKPEEALVVAGKLKEIGTKWVILFKGVISNS
jgi:hypothetical protein